MALPLIGLVAGPLLLAVAAVPVVWHHSPITRRMNTLRIAFWLMGAVFFIMGLLPAIGVVQ